MELGDPVSLITHATASHPSSISEPQRQVTADHGRHTSPRSTSRRHRDLAARFSATLIAEFNCLLSWRHRGRLLVQLITSGDTTAWSTVRHTAAMIICT